MTKLPKLTRQALLLSGAPLALCAVLACGSGGEGAGTPIDTTSDMATTEVPGATTAPPPSPSPAATTPPGAPSPTAPSVSEPEPVTSTTEDPAVSVPPPIPTAPATGTPESGGQGGVGGQEAVPVVNGGGGSGGSVVEGVAGMPTNLGGQVGIGMAGQGGMPDLGPPMHRELILYNDGSPGELIYVNNENPDMGWRITSGGGRDMQLIGNGRVMLGKGGGWDEFQLSDGAKVGGVSNLSGTQATHRLADGTTMVASVSGGAILLRMVNDSGQVQRQVEYPGFSYVRLVRPTINDTFLVTADTEVFEGDAEGNVLWQVTTGNHVWKAMRLANGNTAIATGYDHTLEIYDAQGDLLETLGTTAEVDALYPEFFADFHVRPNGNYFIVNSQADRTENRSIQLLELDPTGALVWQQKQPDNVRSLEAAIVLDGLDLTKLYIELEGVLTAVP